jgi:hypothetical protein
MLTVKTNLKLITTDQQFTTRLLQSYRSALIERFHNPRFMREIEEATMYYLDASIRQTDTYQSMLQFDGQLRVELGVADSDTVMESLIADWVNSVSVRLRQPRIVGGQLRGALLEIQGVQADYRDVLSQGYASYVTKPKTDKEPIVIPWLEWLLTKGTEILVLSHIPFSPPKYVTKASRTQSNVIMRKTKGQGWGVPVEFAGTTEGNFITEAIDKAMPMISKDIMNLF